MEPQASRPRLPKEYGLAADSPLLSWAPVAERLRAARHYWLSTVTPSAGPHVRPVAGMWLDTRFYFGGSTETKWWRNLSTNPKACITLEDTEKVVILEGVTRLVQPDRRLAERLVEESNRKYGKDQTIGDYEASDIVEFVPAVALAWNVLYEDATRWQL